MSTIALPAPFKPRSCSLTLSISQRVSASMFGGSESAIDLLNDRLLMSVELPERKRADGAWQEGFIGAMRGQVNVVALYHFTRPQPRGTMRGTLTLSGSVAQGASSIVVTGGASQASTTLLSGDMIGVGGLLLMVQSDCVANGSGVITVQITGRLRAAQSSGASVTWDKPTALFRLLATSGVHYEPGRVSSTSFDFGEKI